MVRDPFDTEISIGGGIPERLVIPSSVITTSASEKKTRKRGNKIEVNGIIQEILPLSREELSQWFFARLPVYYNDIHNMVTDKETPKPIRVKLYELIVKITGQITEKHEITVINPEDVARRGIEAAKEIADFKIKLLETNGSSH